MIDSKNEIIIPEQPIKKVLYSIEDYPKLRVLEQNYDTIIKEFKTFLLSENSNKLFTPWVEKNLYEQSEPGGWQVMPLIMNGSRLLKYCQNLPALCSILYNVEGLVTVLVSKLKPDTWISPHSGYENYADKILRFHLGLIIPEGDLGFKVKDNIIYWENGKSFIFDDSFVHTAWNFTKEDRYVLIIDFIRNDIDSVGTLRDLILTEEAKQFFDYYNNDQQYENTQVFRG